MIEISLSEVQAKSIIEKDTPDYVFEDEFNESVAVDYAFVSNILNIYNNNLDETFSQNEDLCKFVNYIKKDGTEVLVKKSSVLWMFLKKKSRVSPDRMLRFISKVSDKNNITPYIFIGQFALFLINEKTVVAGQVLGFRYLSGIRRNYSLEYCPIEAPEKVCKG